MAVVLPHGVLYYSSLLPVSMGQDGQQEDNYLSMHPMILKKEKIIRRTHY
ncbi:hypothetical protein [Staphylococcus aureus]